MPEPNYEDLNALIAEQLGFSFEEDPEATVKMAAIGLTLQAWRNTSLEDLHAGDHPSGGFPDSAMMRFNIATTRAVARHVTATGIDWTALKATLTDPDRPLPGGLTVGELANDEFDRLAADIERALQLLAWIDGRDDLAYTLTLLSLYGGMSCKEWYGSPWWTDVVDVFIERLDDPGSSSWRYDDRRWPEHPSVTDREALKQTLLQRPEDLNDDGIDWCLRHGLGHGAAFAGYARWRRRREPGWIDSSPWLSER